MTEHHRSDFADHGSKMVLDRNVHRACPRCMAPGRFSADPIIRDGYTEAMVAEAVSLNPAISAVQLRAGWPGCYVDPSDPRAGQGVGDRCPNCDAPRPADEKLEQLELER